MRCMDVWMYCTSTFQKKSFKKKKNQDNDYFQLSICFILFLCGYHTCHWLRNKSMFGVNKNPLEYDLGMIFKKNDDRMEYMPDIDLQFRLQTIVL